MTDPRSYSALDAYRRLSALHVELDLMAGLCWSVAGATALRAAAGIVRTLATGFFMTITPERARLEREDDGRE